MNATTTARPVFSSSEFTWNGPTGSAEASDLGLRPGDNPPHIEVVSEKSGDQVLFWFWNQTTRGGDLLFTTYLATRAGKHIAVRVYND